MGDHTACVCVSIRFAWAPRKIMAFFREAAPRRGGASLPAGLYWQQRERGIGSRPNKMVVKLQEGMGRAGV